MKISTRGRYALRMMIYMAANADKGTLSLRLIANGIHVSPKYLEQIVKDLAGAGLIRVVRGNTGGYLLVRAPEEYTAWEILCAAEGSLSPVACLDSEQNYCEHAGTCISLPFWQEFDSVIRTFLQSKTLQEIIDGSKDALGIM